MENGKFDKFLRSFRGKIKKFKYRIYFYVLASFFFFLKNICKKLLLQREIVENELK